MATVKGYLSMPHIDHTIYVKTAWLRSRQQFSFLYFYFVVIITDLLHTNQILQPRYETIKPAVLNARNKYTGYDTF